MVSKQLPMINLLHVFIVAPLLIYIGYAANYGTKPNKFIFDLLIVLGALVIAYHGYRAYLIMSLGGTPVINLLHILFIGPSLIYIGYASNYGKMPDRVIFDSMIGIGALVLFYHAYRAYKVMY